MCGSSDAKKISPHSLRHGYALRALRQGAKVPALQKLLGHASVATTSLYVDHLDLAELRAAVPTLPGKPAAEVADVGNMRADELE